MSPETSPPPSELAVAPQPEYQRLEADLFVVGQEVNQAMDTLGVMYENSSAAAKQNIDQFLEEYSAAVDEAEEKREAQPILDSLLETADIPSEYKTAALAYNAVIKKGVSIQEGLENHAAEKAEAVRLQAANLTAKLDYDQVVAGVFAYAESPEQEKADKFTSISTLRDVSQVIGIDKLLAKPEVAPTYQELMGIEDTLSKFEGAWEEEGLLKNDETGPSPENNDSILTAEQMAEIETHLRNVMDISWKYKADPRFKGVDKTQDVLSLMRQLREGKQPDSLDEALYQRDLNYNESLRAAVSQRLGRMLNELPASKLEAGLTSQTHAQFVEQARNINLDKALANIKVDGSLEDLPFPYDETRLKAFLRSAVPPIALASVKRIQFRSLTKEEDKKDNMAGFYRWSEELGGPEIAISKPLIHKNYASYYEDGTQPGKDRERIAQSSAKTLMEDTITHEFGHALHEALPTATLKQWEEKRASDPTSVTAYVKKRYDHHHPFRYMEDFADSMALFIGQPERLALVSPVRFTAMQQIFEEYVPHYAYATKPSQESMIAFFKTVWANNGISADEAKRKYLWYETASHESETSQ